jgi:hypothetical protein
MFLCGYWFPCFQAATKKSGPSKSTAAKKTDGGSQSKASAALEIEDVEVICLSELHHFVVLIRSS